MLLFFEPCFFFFDHDYQRHVSMAKVQSWWRGTACRFRLMASRLDFMPGSLLRRWVRHARSHVLVLNPNYSTDIPPFLSLLSQTGAFVSWGSGVETI